MKTTNKLTRATVLARLRAEAPLLVMMLCMGAVLVIGVRFDHAPVETAKAYCVEHGPAETGAINLVTAIYLEYRAFDTLGETTVLIASIAGVIFFLGQRHA
jgi:multisubunit Na+/H+ antiporter MnhB subunit